MNIRTYPLFLLILALVIFNTNASNETRCLTCHAQQVLDWQQSDHAHAMVPASAKTVLANFDNQSVTFANHAIQFSQKDGQWQVTIGDKTWQVSHVFGHYPLQQYLVATQRGKKQVLPFAWDSRSKEQGGQRWLNLFDEVHIEADRFHWQQPLQNWNGMCADCHSSGLERNYDAQSDSFDTRWQNINVSCRSCHSPADDHPVDVFKKRSALKKRSGMTKEPSAQQRHWQRDKDAKTASLHGMQKQTTQTCYACHSLRTPLKDGFSPEQPYLDQFKPNWLFPPLYHVDGQIKEEVYVYGSFLQSKMHSAGVTCIDCHQPHTGKVKLPDNQVCTQCHASDYYDKKQHHQHENNAGSLCVNCHMPETIYMKVDPRRDHSFRIPSLSFSRSVNTPLACDKCHQDKDDNWLANKYHWKANTREIDVRYAHWMQGQTSTAREFMDLLQSEQLSVIKRASALAFLPFSELQIPPDNLQPFLNSQQPLMRLAAVEALANTDPGFKKQHLSKRLNDERKAVRIAAAQAMLSVPLTDADKTAFEAAFKELIHATEQQSWRGEGRVNRAAIFQQTGDTGQAIEQLEQAIFIDAFYDIAYINLADIYRIQGDEKSAAHWLQKGLAAVPDSGNLHYSLGLQQIRTGQVQQALKSLQKAQQLEPQNYQFIYTLVLMYEELGMTEEKQALLDSLL